MPPTPSLQSKLPRKGCHWMTDHLVAEGDFLGLTFCACCSIHLMASSTPSLVLALQPATCQALSGVSASSSRCAISASDSEEGRSDLFARSSSGTPCRLREGRAQGVEGLGLYSRLSPAGHPGSLLVLVLLPPHFGITMDGMRRAQPMMLGEKGADCIVFNQSP